MKSVHTESPQEIPTSMTSTGGVNGAFTSENGDGGYTSPVAWENHGADCVVITCSDQRFREPTLDFLKHMGYENPQVLAVPSGVAIAHSLTAFLGFLSKAMSMLLSKAIEVTGATELICVAHEDCGGYRAGNVKLIGDITRRLRGKSIREIQMMHLEKAARDLRYTLSGVDLRLFYADVIDTPQGQRVNFSEVPVKGRRRRATRRDYRATAVPQ